jgi:nucleoside-diphosphate-sugar epimerase
MERGQDNASPRVLITGVTGFVGSHIADLLSASGYRVTGLIRKTSNRDFISHLNIDLRLGNLDAPNGLRDVVADQHVIIHSAGLVQAKSNEELMRSNRDATLRMLDAVAQFCPGVKRFIYISSQAAAGPSASTNGIDESVAPRPVSAYGRSKLAAEQECAKFSGKLPIAILRPPSVYGPRDRGVLPFFRLVKSGWYWKFGKNEPFASIVYVKDLALAVKATMESDAAVGETIYTANLETLSQWELQRRIADVMKVEIKPLYTPMWFKSALVWFDAFAAVVAGKRRSITQDKIAELSERFWVCDSSKAHRLMGWRAGTTLEQGFAETIDWYTQHRWL